MSHLFLSKTNIEIDVPIDKHTGTTIRIQDVKLVNASDTGKAKAKVEAYYKRHEITHLTIVIERPIE